MLASAQCAKGTDPDCHSGARKYMSMAENGDDPRPLQAAASQQSIGVISQYVKDLSFESPGAPQSVRNRTAAPAINIGVNVQSRVVQEGEMEVELRMEATAKDGEAVLFAIELVYAGLFRLTNVPPENVTPIVMIECPRLLFPFARQIIADASRNGGFPPLLIDPIDFVQLYRQRLAQMTAAQQQPDADA
jgi:preprotein translocase subunit SecB